MKSLSRRNFIKASAAVASIAVIPSIITSCSSKHSWEEAAYPIWPDKAPDGKPLKAGLIGCGGRGTGAAFDFINAGPNLSVTVLADVFPDKLEACRKTLAEKGVQISDENCFIGFDSYKRVIESDVDVVLLCTPPNFRPEHFKSAIQARKHVFMEKPCALDPVGARNILSTSKRLEHLGLNVTSGTIRRYQKDCIQTWKQVAGGAIGDIVSAHVVRNAGNQSFCTREKGWSDMEYMLRNWYNFSELSGDCIVEQFIHEIDLMSWFMGVRPERVYSYGGRHRRSTGNVYDFFSIEYVYPGDKRVNCSTRQIDGCSNEHKVLVYGTKGYTNCFDTIWDIAGNIIWKYPHPQPGDIDQSWAVPNPYVAEHVRLVNAIRTNTHVNDVEDHVQSVIMGIMARMSAYTGKDVSWDEVMSSMLETSLNQNELGPVTNFSEEAPIPGTQA